MKTALEMLDDIGGADKAPSEQLEQLRSTCRDQNAQIRATCEKLAPACLP